MLRVRKEFFGAVLRQDLAWYDTATTAEFATRMTEDLNKLQVDFGLEKKPEYFQISYNEYYRMGSGRSSAC